MATCIDKHMKYTVFAKQPGVMFLKATLHVIWNKVVRVNQGKIIFQSFCELVNLTLMPRKRQGPKDNRTRLNVAIELQRHTSNLPGSSGNRDGH